MGSAFNHFSHDGTDCYFMYQIELKEITENRRGWTCGYVPKRIWPKSTDKKRIPIRFCCAFPSSSNISADASKVNYSFNLCQKTFLDDHRCNAFSYTNKSRKCVLLHKTPEFETIFNLSSFHELLRLRSYFVSPSGQCSIIPTRDWKVNLIGAAGDGILYQDN